MPRIPVYEQQSSTRVEQPTPQAREHQFVNPLGNSLDIAAAGLTDLAEADIYNQRAIKHKEDADAVANLSVPISDAGIYWQDQTLNGIKQTTDGGMVKQDDGTYIGFRGKVQQDFDAWAPGFLGQVKNEKASLIAHEFVGRLRSKTIEHATLLEAQAGISNRSAKVDQAAETFASQAASTASTQGVKDLIDSSNVMIANSGFDEQTRNQRAAHATNLIIESAIHGAIARDPTQTRAALVSRYGVDPMAPARLERAQTDVLDARVVKYGANFQEQGSAKGVDPAVLTWMVNKESRGDPGAVNNTDVAVTGQSSIGIAQFQPDTARRYGIDPTNPEQSIKGQAAYMKDLLKQYGGNYEKALAGYNWGPGNTSKAIAKWGDQWLSHAPRTTREYVDYVMTNAGKKQTDPGEPAATGYSKQTRDLVDMLPVEKLPAYISAATSAMHQISSVDKAQISQTESDHIAAYMNGQIVKQPLTEAEYSKAFGLEGAPRYANYLAIRRLGADISSIKTMPPSDIETLLENYKTAADPNKPGYELATKRFAMLAQAADQVNKQRSEDPAQYALSNGIGGSQPLDFSDQKKFGDGLAARAGVAATMQDTYQTPFAMLSKAEASTMNRGFQTMTTQQRLGYLGTIKDRVTDPFAYRAVLQQIAPDSPVTAAAGMILSKQKPVVVKGMFSDTVYSQQDVAGLMLEGESLLNPNKASKEQDGKGRVLPMPPEKDLRSQFNSFVGRAFAGSPMVADFSYQGVKAYYAGKSAREGDVSGVIDSGRLKESINAVIGGVSNINGKGEVVRPWGMSESAFRDGAQREFNSAMSASGLKGTQFDNFGVYGLESVGGDSYLVRTGSGSLLNPKTGQPIVLNLGDRPDLSKLIPTDSMPVSSSMFPPPAVVQPKSDKPSLAHPKTK